ncbi:serine/threonine-protein kinase [Vitiosangium sp. GDMCC 1.1324]|uniref:serine/threonine-protein kinase n=1 Tax=Vitiosangium sp. (strain GDMCC 1.1324) TaxID=2138576 RepID=UPI000D336C00|nr:serine/threonine-protein kinase [Vitiosangium sp. GDMCC 1.1324]PTL78134.1 serine/threonine protein kinase [Vitiosangium sp. GDMCC 1.1324]
MTDTLRYVPDAPLDSTLISPASRPENPPAPLSPQQSAPAAAFARRSTVLPRVQWNGDRPNVVPFERERFEELRQLGQGGMGEVVLLKDHDIERMVALKRLPEASDLDRVLRFVEEIRTVGQLDHPNIVPVHDVGIDHLGRYYFVMKHLQGDTLESIIDKLRQGDAATHARFTFPVRVQVFVGVLNALAYAHRKGFIHRDLKPANIMVGPYGEVTVMDWGLARRPRQPDPVALTATPASTATSMREAVSLQTQMGAVVGTPLYMSPEQARGQHDAVDVRSDTYSLSVLFHEFLYLRHYLEGRESLADVLSGVEKVMPEVFALTSNPHQSPVPAELAWFLHKGFAKDPAQRYQSVDEMMQVLQGVMEGRIHVQCQRTLIKRGLHEALRSVDKHPVFIITASTAAAALVLAAIGHLLMVLLG